jgi:hypothetical protein
MKKIGAVLTALTASLICLIVYLRAIFCGFVDVDDPWYIHSCDQIKHLDWGLITWAFTSSYDPFLIPLTSISFALDYHFWAMTPLGYHLTNILLHAMNTGLVVLVANRLCNGALFLPRDSSAGSRQYLAMILLAGLFFGIHPLRVESVAWISERKDVLNGLFSLGSLLFYLRYAQKNAGPARFSDPDYLISFLCFNFSLMAKSVSVVLPAMLLVMDYFPLGRLKRGERLKVVAEKIPYLIVSMVISGITIALSHHHHILISNAAFPFLQRLAVSGNAVFEYCRLMIYPFGILPYYMIPDPIPLSYAVNTAIVILFTIVCLWTARSRPWIPAVWLLFLLPLIPVLAFFQNGDQALAARFTYLPSVIPCIVGSVALTRAYHAISAGRFFRLVAGTLVLAQLTCYSVVTERLIDVWTNSVTLWSRVIDEEPNAIAFENRGKALVGAGDYLAAANDFSSAILTAPSVWQPYLYNLYAFRGEAERSAKHYKEAVDDLTIAIAMFPHPAYYHCRGLALRGLGFDRKAEDDLNHCGATSEPLRWYTETDLNRL